jgi:hypothetical protein
MASGSAYTVFDIPQGCRVGVLICYDNNIGENVRITALGFWLQVKQRKELSNSRVKIGFAKMG